MTDDSLAPGRLFAKFKASNTLPENDEERQGQKTVETKKPDEVSTTSAANRYDGVPSTSATNTKPTASDSSAPKDRSSAPSTKPASQPTSTTSRSGPLVANQSRQKGNPVFKYIRNVVYEWGDIKPDFELGSGACLLYCTLKWHKLHPQYIETRFKEIGKTYDLQVLLAVVNIEEPKHVLRELNIWCLRAGWTLFLAYSVEEAAEYLESFKIYEHKTVEMVCSTDTAPKAPLKGPAFPTSSKNMPDFSRAIDLLTSIRSVNRSDAQRLLGTFGSIANIAQTPVHELSLCPGLGQLKAQRVFDAFRQTFIPENSDTNAGKKQKVVVE